MEKTMADNTVVHIGEDSPEYVAYRLLERIAHLEGRPLGHKGSADRKYILDTYAECLDVVRNPTARSR
jgi:hypothetical protein